MEREIRITEDGSHTLFVPELDESYHSIHGAVAESLHVFIKYGFETIQKQPVRILEAGFGTGLNALLTLRAGEKHTGNIYFHTVEKYPLGSDETDQLNYGKILGGTSQEYFIKIHRAEWGKPVRITEKFTLYKERADFRQMSPDGKFDLVYFDAFDPAKQPYLWTDSIFSLISGYMNPDAVLVTYSAKGSIRRALSVSGLITSKVPGPPGKREMTRAVKSLL